MYTKLKSVQDFSPLSTPQISVLEKYKKTNEKKIKIKEIELFKTLPKTLHFFHEHNVLLVIAKRI